MKKFSLQINTFGFEYTKSDLYFMLGISLLLVGSVCYVHQLQLVYSVIVLGSALMLVPFLINAYFTYKREKRHFEEYCRYYENVKMYFKVYKKINLALHETIKLFDENCLMSNCIKQATTEIYESGDYQKALNFIDANYHNTYLQRLHDLLITGEKHGGDSVYYNLDIINYEEWKDSMKEYQIQKKHTRRNLYVVFGTCFIISIFLALVFKESDLGLFKSGKYQLYTFVELELILISFAYLYVSLVNKQWIRRDE